MIQQQHPRALTVVERLIAGVTVALAVATMALAVAGSARADTPGVLPDGDAYYAEPATAASHAEAAPDPRR